MANALLDSTNLGISLSFEKLEKVVEENLQYLKIISDCFTVTTIAKYQITMGFVSEDRDLNHNNIAMFNLPNYSQTIRFLSRFQSHNTSI